MAYYDILACSIALALAGENKFPWKLFIHAVSLTCYLGPGTILLGLNHCLKLDCPSMSSFPLLPNWDYWSRVDAKSWDEA